MLTQARLKELLEYTPETGVFVWRVNQGRALVGAVAGCLDGRGYIRIRLDGCKYRAHRLAFLYMLGQWPSDQVDHRDLAKCNNIWLNLRAANQTQQNANRLTQPNNTSGFRGVTFLKSRCKWRAILSGRYVGTFDKKDDAVQAYCKAAAVQFGEFVLNSSVMPRKM